MKLIAALTGIMAAVLLAVSMPARAQAYDPYAMEQRLQAIEEELSRLRAEVQRAGPAGDPGAPPSFQRLNDLEQAMRQLTGQVEQFGFDVRSLKDRLDRIEKEMNFRVGQLEGGSPPVASADGAGTTPSAPVSTPPAPAPGAAPSDPSSPPAQPGANDANPPGTLGAITEAPAGSDAESLYNQAMDALTRSDYGAALGLFRQVVSGYPDTDFAAQSQYWIADIHYVQSQFDDAAAAFAAVLTRYPNAGRGPESMLKLGLSLLQTGKKPEACTTLTAIKTRYPNASEAVLSRADREAKRAACPG